MRRTWLFLVLAATLAPQALAKTVYVNKNAPGPAHDGAAWSTAYQRVQTGIGAAVIGDEVWVAASAPAAAAYAENLVMKGGVAVYGGFAGTETARSERNWATNVTVLTGSNPSYKTVTCKFPNVVLDGFTVRSEGGDGCVYVSSGTAALSNNIIIGDGPGVHVEGSAAAVTLNNNTISGHFYGVFLSPGTATLTGNNITGNGAGVMVNYSTATLINNSIIGNGGGVELTEGTMTLYNNTISGSNSGVDVYGGTAKLINNTVSGNGTGVFVVYGTASLTNNIVAFNGAGVTNQYGAVAGFSHNDVFGNAGDDYSGYTPPGGKGNISVDPMLSNPYRDVHIQPNSPCIDAGDDTAVVGTTDIDGQARLQGAHVDIGSDESDGTTWVMPFKTWYVSPSGNDANDGLTWATAKQTIGGALALAQGPAEVWVAKGTYPELLVPGPGLALYGGFAGTETARNQRDWVANATIISGNDPDSDSVIRCTYPGIVLDGFTVRNGRYGVTVRYGMAALTNNTVSGNDTGVYVYHVGKATLSNNTISGNIGDGVRFSTDYAITLSGNTIPGNGGGGVVIYGGTTRIANNTISGNGDNGVYVEMGTATLTNNTIAGNDGGVCAFAGSTTMLTNNTIYGNRHEGLYLIGGATMALANNIVAFNLNGLGKIASRDVVSTFSHNDVYGNTAGDFYGYTPPAGQGNFSVDPQFVDRANGDFHLQAASPCIDAGDDAMVKPGDTDRDGLPRIRGAHVDIGAYELQYDLAMWSIPLGSPAGGGVTVAERVAYVGGSDGKLHARDTRNGADVPGFPVDINAAVGATVKLPSRPAVYYGKTGKAIYLTTDRGDVLRILPTGQVAWHVRPLPGQTISTPAVTPAGEVFVNLSTGSGPFDNYVFKMDEATGRPLTLSRFLGYTNVNDLGDFSPAANGRYLYVNAGWGSRSGLTVLNQDNMTVRSSFAAGEQCLPPLVLGADLILASKGGKVLKLNAVTLNPDLGFGRFGIADVGSQISAAPFADAAGNVYLGTADGRILKRPAGAPSFKPFYATSGCIAGLTINRAAGVLGFGTSTGSFVQVPLDNPAGAVSDSPGGPISTGTVYESLTDRFIFVTDNGVLCGYPSAK